MSDDEWEVAPTRKAKQKDTSRSCGGGRGGQGSTGKRGTGGGNTTSNSKGFNGWAKPKPPRPEPNASWPNSIPPQVRYTSKESEELLVQRNSSVGSNSAPSKQAVASRAAISLICVPLSELMTDYGEQDKDFDKKIIPTSVPEEREISKQNEHTRATNQNNSRGVLVPHDKAPIHIEFVSYGHHYGVPSEATGKGGYSRSRPLPPYDVRDLDRAPHHVAKLSGLSHHVKRELLTYKDIEKDQVDGTSSEAKKAVKFEADMRSAVRTRADEIAEESSAAIVEAIEDGYGHASPLNMSIYVGSEFGRHRSVVIVEAAAVTLRNMLRQNEGDRFASTPVSVGTRHRDVDKAHRMEEAFGLDLKREAQAAKRKQEREERELMGRW